ncbi:MAG TPA: integrase [Candidatus Tectomicrobia bacterium]|nr:integrase [Candidatus Tectomicrobia bacterium]
MGILPVIHALLAFGASLFRSRRSLHLTVLALQHQVAVYQRSGRRPHLHPTDRLFWAWLSRLWTGWQDTLVLVQPRTVIAWQRKRFREHWRPLSHGSTPGRPTISQGVQDLIRKMSQVNPTWGAPRIVGELRKLGIDVAKSTVEKYRVRSRKPPSHTWRAFLKTHVMDLVSLDFFVVPTVAYKVLFVLVILAHHRRHVVHFNVTEHPTAQWTAQQVVEAFPWDEAPRYLLRDRDRIYGDVFRQRVWHMGIEEVLIAPRSPWPRPVQRTEVGPIREVPEVDGLHHHYERLAA